MVKYFGRVKVFYYSFKEATKPTESCITFLDVTNLTLKKNPTK